MRALSLFLSLTIASASLAQLPSDQAAPAAPGEVKEKPVCRSVPQTGTRFSKRVCKSAADWQVLDRHTINGDGFAGVGGGGRQQDTAHFGPAGRL